LVCLADQGRGTSQETIPFVVLLNARAITAEGYIPDQAQWGPAVPPVAGSNVLTWT
jgi:hypothetical protein